MDELYSGYKTAYIDGSVASNIAYRPQFVSNNYKEGKKVVSETIFVFHSLLLVSAAPVILELPIIMR